MLRFVDCASTFSFIFVSLPYLLGKLKEKKKEKKKEEKFLIASVSLREQISEISKLHIGFFEFWIFHIC